jgi:UDP-2,3-diacylglucosamine hydrolase
LSKVYFFSDAHLGAHSKDLEKRKEQRLVSFLQMVDKEDAELVIVGDLFDFWFEYQHVIPRRHFRVLGLLSLLSTHRKVHYAAGNHDFWFDSFISQEIGLIVHENDLVLENGGRRIYITHGDGLLENDHGYRFLKKVLRNKVNIFLYRILHPDFGIPLALFFSHLSRNANQRKNNFYRDDDYRDYAYKKIDSGYDIVVLGHTHWAALDPYKNGHYINPGFWGKDFTYAVVEDGEPGLFVWNGERGIPHSPTFPPGNRKFVN